MRLHGFEIPVSDVNRAYRFYAEVLEFPVVGRFNEQSAVFFLGDVHGGMVTLVQTDERPHGRGVLLVLSADGGLDEVRGRLEGRGVTFLGPTATRGTGRGADFLDTEGNRLSLFESSVAAQFRAIASESNAGIRARLDELCTRLSHVLADVGREQAAYCVAPGEWPILGQVAHIIDTLDSCGVIAHKLAAGHQPPRDLLLEREYPLDSRSAGLAELERAFEGARSWIARLPGAEQSPATLVHGVFGALNAREWAGFMLFHISMHIKQIEEIKAHAGYPRSS